MKVQHAGSEPVYLAAHGDFVDPGETVDVPDDHAASLLEQGWLPGDGSDRPTKAELIAVAEERGVEVRKSWTVDQILAALEEHANPEPDPAPAEQED